MTKNTLLVSSICVLIPISLIIATVIGLAIKKGHFILYLLVCISSVALALNVIWGIIHGNSQIYASLGSQMFGPLFGPIFEVGIWLVIFIINGIWAIQDFRDLKIE